MMKMTSYIAVEDISAMCPLLWNTNKWACVYAIPARAKILEPEPKY